MTADPIAVLTLDVETFNQKLHEAADVHTTGVSTDPRKGTTIHLDAGNAPVEFTITPEGIQITAQDWRLITDLKAQRRSHHQRHLHLMQSPVEVLARHNLPLYWNQEWLEAKHAELGTYGAIAQHYKREVQGAHASSIANFARDAFGISPRDQLLEDRNRFVQEYEELHETVSQADFAKKYKVTPSTINRWIRDAHKAYMAMAKNPELVSTKHDIATFALEHNLLPSTVNVWRRRGSEVYSKKFASQPKSHYHSRSDYARLQQQFYDLYREANGEINQNAVAKELGVNRSTIADWIARYGEHLQYPSPNSRPSN